MRKSKEASKNFLDAERGAGSNQPSGSGTSRGTNPVQELIKCFCGVCESFFKRPAIEYALKANGEEILRDPEAREILKKFLIFRKGNSRLKSPAFKILDLFELSEAILQNHKDLDDNHDEVEELLFTEYWEEEFENAIKIGTTAAIQDFLHKVMRECAIRLENTEDYPLLKVELRKKLK